MLMYIWNFSFWLVLFIFWHQIVSLEVLEKICETLDCDLGDIASFIDEDDLENE